MRHSIPPEQQWWLRVQSRLPLKGASVLTGAGWLHYTAFIAYVFDPTRTSAAKDLLKKEGTHAQNRSASLGMWRL